MGRDGCRMKSGDAWCGLRKRMTTAESISNIRFGIFGIFGNGVQNEK